MSELRITVLKNNAPWGPFTREQIKGGLGRGDFTLQVPAHAPGLKEWRPLGEVLEHVEHAAVLPPIPPEPETLPPIPSAPPVLPILPGVKPGRGAPPLPVPEEDPVKLIPASLILRFIAFALDCAILFLPLLFFFALAAMTLEIRGAWEDIDHESRMQQWSLLNRNFHHLLLLSAIGVGWIYAAGLEASRWQGTVGKQWLGMKVTDARGERISFLRATGRHAAKYLSALPCFFGFIMALFSPRRRALHDRLAGTRVVRK